MSRSTDTRRLARWAGAVGVLMLVALGPAGRADAHAIVDDMAPADGSALADTPGEVIVHFSEAILADGIEVELNSTVGVAGEPVAALDPLDPSVMIITLPPLPDGTHQVRVTARDREDLHEVIARTSFSIGVDAPEPSPPIVAAPEYIESSARWLFAAGLALLFGVLVVRTRWPDVRVDRPQRLRTIAVFGLVAIVAGRVGILLARAHSLHTPFAEALGTVLGTGDARRLLFVALAVGCAVPLAASMQAVWLDMPVRAQGHLSVRNALGWVGALWLAVLAAWGDHSALEGAVEPGTAVAKAGHLVGLGLWIGTLVVVLAVNASATSRRRGLVDLSRVAVLGAVITVASGLLLASRLVVSLTGLFSTAYGWLLVAKLALIPVAALLGLGLHAGWRPRWSMAEAGVLGVVAAAGALMATAGPAIETAFLPATAPVYSDATAVLADDLLVQVRAIPGRPGPNTLEVRVSDTRRPSPGPVVGTALVVGEDQPRALELPNENGFTYLEGVELVSGATPVAVDVERTGWPTARADLQVVAAVAAYVHPAVVTSTRLQMPLILAGLILMVVAILIARTLFVVARPRKPSTSDEREEPVECDDSPLSSSSS